MLVRGGEHCDDLMAEHMRDIDSERLELGELWTFCGKNVRLPEATGTRRSSTIARPSKSTRRSQARQSGSNASCGGAPAREEIPSRRPLAPE